MTIQHRRPADAEDPLAAHASVERAVSALEQGEQTWSGLTLGHRRRLLTDLIALVARHAEEWVEIAGRIKGLRPGSPLMGEEWISGPWAVLGYARALADTLARLEKGEDPLSGFATRPAPGGRTAVEVLPHGIHDRLLLNGFSAEVWTRPGVTPEHLRSTAGLAQRDPSRTRGRALVLGAGNILSIAPLDTLYQLYAMNRVVALKPNPVTDPLRPVLEAVFAPFIELGAVVVVAGGADVGSALVRHPGIGAVHMTGSEATHDAIVWGPGERGTAAKAAGVPLLDKPVTSELGGVAPVIVQPGRWSRADLRHQARHVATQRLHNGGSNCIAAQVVIVSRDWPQKAAFLDELRAALSAAPQRPAWYPGTEERVSRARALHETAECVGGAPGRTLLPSLDLSDDSETAFRTEYFGPVLGVAELDGTGAYFLHSAVSAANDRLRGTLGANIVIDPRTRRDLRGDFDHAVQALHYGTIGVNAWTGVGYLVPYATWGAFPGHPLDDIQSGRGVVHNAGLLADVERTVVRGPFRPAPRSVLHGEWTISPKPPWFVDNRTAATTGRRLVSFAARPRWSVLPGIFLSALRG